MDSPPDYSSSALVQMSDPPCSSMQACGHSLHADTPNLRWGLGVGLIVIAYRQLSPSQAFPDQEALDQEAPDQEALDQEAPDQEALDQV